MATSKEPVITWIGHATFLIQVNGLNILTDPIFGNASAFFPRVLPPGIALAQLPAIDIVLLSHNHRDHCDLPSLRAVQKAYPNLQILAAHGDKAWLQRRGLCNVQEFEWWQDYTHGGVAFTFLPAHHWSAQGIWDRNRSLWGSWMISAPAHPAVPAEASGEGWELVEGRANGSTGSRLRQGSDGQAPRTDIASIYFAGDTAYSPHFAHIAYHFPNITTALLPIAPEFPHPSMRKSHIDSAQAVQAFLDLKAQTFIPMHWGTFPFGTDTFLGPIERLRAAWATHGAPEHNLIIPKVGQRIALV